MLHPTKQMTRASESDPTAVRSLSAAGLRSGSVRARRRSVACNLLTLGAFVLAGVSMLGCDEDGPVFQNGAPEAPDPLAEGQLKIDEGDYEGAIESFTEAMEADPSQIDAYRGRAEAKLMLGQYADAYYDLFALAIGTVQPDSVDDLIIAISDSYAARLEADPENVPALTGAAFAGWSFWGYSDALIPLEKLYEKDPESVFANLFRGSNRLFSEEDIDGGIADMEAAIALAPDSPDVRFVVADAYTYALPDSQRAYDEATTALHLGLDTPRVHAIIATSLNEAGDVAGAAYHFDQHITQVTKEFIYTDPLDSGSTMMLDLLPWQTYQIPIEATAEKPIVLGTNSTSPEVWDSILVILRPDGTPIIANDDYDGFFAGLNWVPPESGTYLMRVTSFEAINRGPLTVTRE